MTQGAANLADTLRCLGYFAQIRGSRAEAVDLGRAQAAVEALGPSSVSDLLRRARRDRLTHEPGISAALHWRLKDIAVNGPAAVLRAAKASLPSLHRHLLDAAVVAAAEACILARELSVLTFPDLAAVVLDGRAHRAVGPIAADRLQRALVDLRSAFRPTPLARALDLVEHVRDTIEAGCTGIDQLTASGDARRFSPDVESVLLVGRAPDPPAALERVCALPGFDDVLHCGPRRAVLSIYGSEVDLRVAALDEYGTVLFGTTGTQPHVRAVEQRRGTAVLFRTEEEVYTHAALPFIVPELREDRESVAAAATGAIPDLVSRDDIRGDLHVHSTWSDGRDSVEAMVQACRALGYQYVAITDHSERAVASRTLARHQLAWQAAEIGGLRERYPDIAILHGVEVDILEDGSLDFPDELLERLDIVLASLHEHAGQDGPTLTRRYLAVMRHPLVTIITHPANRLPGRHDGYPLDFDALYAAAAETGTALEVDGGPAHLDLDGKRAREAVAAGVTLVIDSDCHRAESLERQMRMGLGTARRGWIEAPSVLNTRSIEEVRAFIAAKRR